jgi:threonine/homoserine/homoserine lactone efflux protein
MPSKPRHTDSDMLIRGAVCAVIGAIILLAPYVARSPSVRELMGQATLVGWFSLVLGLIFIGRTLWRRKR